MSVQNRKKQAAEAIENAKSDIHAVADEIYKNPEYGYKEENTSKIVQDFFKRFNVPVKTGLGITGTAIQVDLGEGPHILVMGELDGISSSTHPDALPNGASHACGHNHQIAGLLGAAVGLLESDALSELKGKSFENTGCSMITQSLFCMTAQGK